MLNICRWIISQTNNKGFSTREWFKNEINIKKSSGRSFVPHHIRLSVSLKGQKVFLASYWIICECDIFEALKVYAEKVNNHSAIQIENNERQIVAQMNEILCIVNPSKTSSKPKRFRCLFLGAHAKNIGSYIESENEA